MKSHIYCNKHSALISRSITFVAILITGISHKYALDCFWIIYPIGVSNFQDIYKASAPKYILGNLEQRHTRTKNLY